MSLKPMKEKISRRIKQLIINNTVMREKRRGKRNLLGFNLMDLVRFKSSFYGVARAEMSYNQSVS